VVWIHASNPTRFEQGYRDIADKIPIPGREDPKADILQLVCAWLSDRRNGQWLMILDNADDDSVFFAADEDSAGTAQISDITSHTRPLESFLPQTPNGTILITSRNRIAAINLVGTCGGIVQVEPMDEEDALALLNTRVPFSESSKADAKALVQALERIPLAITHAAAYINTRAPMTTMSDYLELFRKSEANQVRLLGKKGLKDLRRDHSIRHAVIATWRVSFTQIQKTEQSAADLLALMSMFDRQGVPISLLQNNTSQLDFDDALAPLLSFSLVRAEIGKRSFEMHRLVQLSIRSWLEADEQLSKWIKESIRVLTAAFPSGDYKTWADCQVLLPHAREAISHVTGDEEDVLNQAKIALSTGWYLYLRGEYKTAEKVVRMSVEGREKVLGPEHPDTLASVNNLGSVLERQGKYEEAEAIHRRALEGREKVLGPEHPDTLSSVDNLGLILSRQGKYEEAEAIHRWALEGREKVLGPEHPDTLISIDNLGWVLERQGKYEEAEAMHWRALEAKEKVLGPEHPDTLTSVDNLGSVLERQGKYEEAEAMHRRALEAKEKVLGPEHPDTLTSVDNLGSVLESQGKYEEAEAMHRRALEGCEKVLGPEHPDTLTSVNNLGSVLESQGKYEEAEAMHRRDLRGSEKVLGLEHPDTLTSVNNLGWVLKSQGKYEEAEAMYWRALEGREKVLGPEHPDTLGSVNNLGSVLESQGKYEEAEAMHRRDLKGSEKIPGREK
jgi:tetratricopeptide (TPR) repeat protein